jgi:hypothetical protein
MKLAIEPSCSRLAHHRTTPGDKGRGSSTLPSRTAFDLRILALPNRAGEVERTLLLNLLAAMPRTSGFAPDSMACLAKRKGDPPSRSRPQPAALEARRANEIRHTALCTKPCGEGPGLSSLSRQRAT